MQNGGMKTMQVEMLLKSLELPKKYYDNNFDISVKYAKEAKIFIDRLEEIDGTEFADVEKQMQIQDRFNKLKSSVEKNVKRIQSVFQYYEGANPKMAQKEFDEMMEEIRPYLFISTIDDWIKVDTSEGKKWTQFRTSNGRYFFRVRGVAEKTDNIQNNPDELFHIPLNKKALTNNERFSLAGFPSLYLSSMLPLAWQEAGYPQKYYYSQYQYIKMQNSNRIFDEELKFLALYSPIEIYNRVTVEKYNDFPLWLNWVYCGLIMYPLILACAFVNHSGKASYKQEYVIPQMLMQWVQRNKECVQGISYFTCVDTKMLPSNYCAYNIVIPTLEPYDKKMYSQRLRDEFTWTMPQYYEVPLLNSSDNKEDRQEIYKFINRIQSVYKNYIPSNLRDVLEEMEQICICLYELMNRGNGSDIQLIIHTLNLINTCYHLLKQKDIHKMINEIINEIINQEVLLTDDAYTNVVNEIKEIAEEFLKKDRESNSVASIIDKYRHTLWNDLNQGTYIDIAYREEDKIDVLTSWLHNNHLLFSKHIITEKDVNGKSLDEVETPLVRRMNSVSIYDKKGKSRIDYKKEGFDPNINGKELLKESKN